MHGLHVYHGREYSHDITIRHLLQQTSGLSDVFYPLLEQVADDDTFRPTPRDAIIWGKTHRAPVATPGTRHVYTDTNYLLLGLIITAITRQPFHQVVHELLFAPLGMDGAYVYGYSAPQHPSPYPLADLFLGGRNLKYLDGIPGIDYAGGSICAPLAEFLHFFQQLVAGKLVRPETLETMINDARPMGLSALGFRYGYSIWSTMSIPLVLPKRYYCYGCVGVTGAVMFHHPATRSYIIGTFNHDSYKAAALRFLLSRIIPELVQRAKK
jgi:D-alanyl-D-alanine carboxypeptidase